MNEKLEIIDANKRFSKIKDAYFFRQNLLEYFHQDFIEILKGAIFETLSDHNSSTIELKTIDGRLFLFNLSLVLVGRPQEGRVIKLLGTDITDLREREGIISDVFRSVSLGLLFINHQSKILPGYSAFTSMILENFELDHADIYDVLFYKNQKKLNPDEAQAFEDLRSIFGKDKNEFSTITFLAPKILEIPSKMKPGGKKVIQITLEPIVEDSLVKRYMMILQDMTDVLNLNPPKLNDDISKMMKLIVDDIETLQGTFNDIQSLIIRVPANILGKLNEEYKGIFHTVKGMLRLMGLSYLGGLVHEMESVIKDSQVDESINYQGIWDQFLIDWTKIKKIFDVYLEDHSGLRTSSPNEYVATVLSKIRNLPLETSRELFLSPTIALTSVEFSNFDDINRSLEGLLIKNIDKTSLDVDLDAEYVAVRSTSSSMQALKSSLIHLLNNSFAHGFPDVDRACQIKIRTKLLDSFLVLDYQDNGTGVRIDKVRAKLKKENPDQVDIIDQFSDIEVAQYIFKSGLSTKEVADEMAGRGEGLSSAVLEIERLGGSLVLQKFNDGCHFQIKVPIVDKTLHTPVVVTSKIINEAFSIYFDNLSIASLEPDGPFVIHYPHLFYEAMRILCRKVTTQSSIELRYSSDLSVTRDDLLDVNEYLSYNNMRLLITDSTGGYVILIREKMNSNQIEIFERLKKLQQNFSHHLELK